MVRVVGCFGPLLRSTPRFRHRTRRHRLLAAPEAILCADSAFLVYAVSVVGNRAIGAYVAWGGRMGYTDGWLSDVVRGVQVLRPRAS